MIYNLLIWLGSPGREQLENMKSSHAECIEKHQAILFLFRQHIGLPK